MSEQVLPSVPAANPETDPFWAAAVANRQVRKLIVSFSSRPGVKSPVEEQAAAGELELEMVPRGDQILSGR